MDWSNFLTPRAVPLGIGYILGMFLTAEVVVHHLTGRSSADFGSGNPGMANVMRVFGFRAGITVLAGDIGKTMLACLIAWLLYRGELGHLAIYYAGIGATLGHNYPAWRGFRGGKGVACSCTAYPLFHMFWGLLADIAGMLVVFATQYLCIGAVAIPAFFLIPTFLFYGKEAGFLTLFMSIQTLIRHWPDLRAVQRGEKEKVDVPAKIKERLHARAASPESGDADRACDTGASGNAEPSGRKRSSGRAGRSASPRDVVPDAEMMRLLGLEAPEESGAESIRLHIFFSGIVQGVGFRYQAKHAAQYMDLTGWVQNMEDGRVEMEVQGRPSDIGRMMTLIRKNTRIRINSVQAYQMSAVSHDRDFRVKGY